MTITDYDLMAAETIWHAYQYLVLDSRYDAIPRGDFGRMAAWAASKDAQLDILRATVAHLNDPDADGGYEAWLERLTAGGHVRVADLWEACEDSTDDLGNPTPCPYGEDR